MRSRGKSRPRPKPPDKPSGVRAARAGAEPAQARYRRRCHWMSRTAPASDASLRRTREQEPVSSHASYKAIDLTIIAAIVIFAAIAMARSGSRRGFELMPWPDGVEYAAQAVNIDSGLGPVLHFGGYSYPSRYTEGYPLILAAAWPLVGHDVAWLFLATTALGLVAVAALYILT